MKKLTNVTIALLAFIALDSTASAQKHILDDIDAIQESSKKAAFIQRHLLALRDFDVLERLAKKQIHKVKKAKHKVLKAALKSMRLLNFMTTPAA